MTISQLRIRLQDIEVQNNNADELRTLVGQIEVRVKELIGLSPFRYYHRFPKEEVIEEVHELLKIRQWILDSMFTWPNDEIEQIIKVNDLLFKLTKKMFHRTAELYRSILRCGVDSSFDDDYEVEGALLSGVEYPIWKGYVDDSRSVLHFDNDNYYGSDFSYMLCVIEQDYCIRHSSNSIHECYVYNHKGDTPVMTDEELRCDYREFDNGNTWAPYYRNFTKLKDVTICYALHALFEIFLYSLPDILRINSYDVEAKITCQHFRKLVE